MFIIGATLLALIGLVILKIRAPRKLDPQNLGWMSEQWLNEHRASLRSSSSR